jgi:DNA-binding CsgD family transcriptional regulator
LTTATLDLDFDDLFLHLPMAIIVARNRVMIACNRRALEVFQATSEQIIGHSFEILYPERKDFENAAEHFGPMLAAHADFEDNRVMRRLDGTHFWIGVRGYGFNQSNPYELAAWVFNKVAPQQNIENHAMTLTERERDVAAFLLDGLTSKEIARRLGISPRTVDVHRGALIRKHGVSTKAELIQRLAQ